MTNKTPIATNEWFSEICKEQNSSFSMKIKGKLHEETTQFQTISIYDTFSFGHLMAIDGFIMLTQRDNFIYHEMMAHPVLFQHPDPKDVLIIGGGDCGTLLEVSKHNVNSITQVEIDEKVTDLAKIYFPELCKANNDPRVNLVFEDAIKWVKNAKTNSLDVIIIDSTDPIGPGEGLFSTPFYQQCLTLLRNNGILIHQSESPLFQINLLKSMRNKMKNAGFAKTNTLFFPLPTYPSGWWSATMASINNDFETIRNNDIPNLLYYSSKIHKASYAMPPFLENKFKSDI